MGGGDGIPITFSPTESGVLERPVAKLLKADIDLLCWILSAFNLNPYFQNHTCGGNVLEGGIFWT